MTVRERLRAYAEDTDITLLFLDPPDVFDPAILGLVTGFGQEPAVLYDKAKVLRALQQMGMSEEEADEYFSFNVEGAYVGPATPRFLEWV